MKRILIIDDEQIVLEVLCKILELEGYEVVTAASGDEGIELFAQNPFDLVVTDMVMPGKDGLQTILALRQESPDLAVIAMSGGGTISKERYLAVAGYLDGIVTITKPFSLESITEAVAELLAGGDEER
ncbi:MAG: response regulator [Deltaproteobacteria bacterium]|nr:response regulator [Deltaproteobacteria bacterium]